MLSDRMTVGSWLWKIGDSNVVCLVDYETQELLSEYDGRNSIDVKYNTWIVGDITIYGADVTLYVIER